MADVALVDVLELRHSYSHHLARRVVKNASDADLEQLESYELLLREVGESAQSYVEVATVGIDFQRAWSEASHDALLTSIDGLLGELLVRLSVIGLAERPDEVWRLWMQQLMEARKKMIEAYRRRDVSDAMAATEHYMETQRQLFSTDPLVSQVSLSSPEIFNDLPHL